jgi:hypothetical protein
MTWQTGTDFTVPAGAWTTGTDLVVPLDGVSLSLFKDATGQLVLAESLPPGGSYVDAAASTDLADVAAWFRALDAADSPDWHPANYYADDGEATGTISGYLTRQTVTLPADAFGEVGDYTEAAGQFVVWMHGADITAQCTFSADNAVDLTADIDAAGAYAATDLAAGVGSIELTATYKNQALTLVFTVVSAPHGMAGDSARRAYSKTSLSSLASTPATITTSGAASFPPDDSWGTGTVWQATSPAITAGESVYMTDGFYSAETDETVWAVPYLAHLQVGQLDAITTNTGTLTVDESISSGQTDFDTGTGFWLEGGATPKMSLGNSSKGIKWDGSTFTVRGEIVTTSNLVANAASKVANATLTSPTTVPTGASWTTITGTVSLPAVAAASHRGAVLFLFSLYLQSGNTVAVKWNVKVQYSVNGGSSWSNTGIEWTFRTLIDNTGDFYNVAAVGYFDGMAGVSANAIQFRLQAYHSTGVDKDVGSATDGYCQLSLLELKR